MGQELGPLYGELVIPFRDGNQSDIQSEVSAMEETTRLMIEEAAYFLAEKRGFKPGYELADWLQAEAQIRK
ncbi:hypothetical protein SCT_2834 [Sulfuricella sp. T08]|uniref:DUF2934 domain-containing protein n=1 Tax=Sulfuricella sp. T08 TaxID=1632857 RepID=UPI0006179D95|nr:DUF2934 domain-containing protein [Sulfuricella sp. T08]GAO37412.1 hypothetical protein SCT_2834 [Sulfuricella sp. T08]